MRRTLPILVLLAVMSGCVTRIIRIASEPEGADIWLDGKPVGKTPKDIPFVWYGDRELSLEKEGYHSVREIIKVRPPWWQVFPIDFFAEFLVPIPKKDIHEFKYTLKPFGDVRKEFEETKKRAEEFRKKANEKPQ